MSNEAKKYREAAKAKAHRLATGDPHQKVDGSSWTPSPALEADKQTGERPISRKRGGKVKGEHEHKRADRHPRKAGGRTVGDEFLNRDVKEANTKREGARKYGDGLKRGGKAHKDDGGSIVPTERMAFQSGPSRLSRVAGLKHGGHADKEEDEKLIHEELHEAGVKPHHKKSGGSSGHWIAGATKNKGALHRKLGVPEGEKIPEKKLEKAEHSKNPTERKEANLAKTLKGLKHAKGGSVDDGELEGTRPLKGGRMAHARGGKAKKGAMNVNIIIGAGGHHDAPGGPMGGMGGPAPAPPRAVPVPPPSPPLGAMPMNMPPPPMSGGMPPAGGVNMPRKRGGRTGYPIEDGSGSGLGRLEKIGRK